MNGIQGIPQVSVNAQRLYEQLRAVAPEDTITYDALTQTIGVDVRTVATGALSTARRMAHRLDSAVFVSVRGVGLKRVNDVEKVGLGSDLRPLRRMLRRKARILGAVKYDALPADAQRQHNTGLAMLGAVQLMTQRSEVRRVDGAVAQAQRPISFDETLKLFAQRQG